jgi:hypothetical protein
LFSFVHSIGSVIHRPFFPMLNTFLLGFFNIGYYRLVMVFIGYDTQKPHASSDLSMYSRDSL